MADTDKSAAAAAGTTTSRKSRPAAARAAAGAKPAAGTAAADGPAAPAAKRRGRAAAPAAPAAPAGGLAAVPAAPARAARAARAARVKPEPGPVVKRKEFLDRVLKATGAKKKLARPVVEATLAALAEGLGRGEELVLPPLGRARVVRAAAGGEAGATTVKIRPAGGKRAAAGGKQTLADDGDSD
jgi:DNA-binding protein HU-alpha